MSNIQALIESQTADIAAGFGDSVKIFVETFNFRTAKTLPEGANWPAVVEKELNEDGELVEVVKGYKRASFPVALYRPTAAELVRFLEDACPEQEMLLDIVEDFVFSAAQKIVSDSATMETMDFPLDKISFALLARLPKEVKTRGLDKEELAAFCKDYIEVMPEITGRTVEQCTYAASAIEKRFANIKTDRLAQTKLRAYLDQYITNAPRAESFATVLDVLVRKLDELLAAETVALGDAM